MARTTPLPHPAAVRERALLVHRLLAAAGVPHALGGALALVHHVGEVRLPRAVEVLVVADPAHPQELLALLPGEVACAPGDAEAARRTGRLPLAWPHPAGPPTPVELVLGEGTGHVRAVDRAEPVALGGVPVPLVGATDLLVLAALRDRRQDWADVEELVRHGDVDLDEAHRAVTGAVGPHDGRVRALNEVIADVALDRPAGAAFTR